MEDLEHPALIEEWIQNIDSVYYEKHLHKDEKLPSLKKKMYPTYKTECWPKIILDGLNWLPFIETMDFTADRIYNDKN